MPGYRPKRLAASTQVMNVFPLQQRKIARIDPPFELLEIDGDAPGVVGPRFLHVRQYRGLPVSHDPPVRMDATATELSDSLVPVSDLLE